MVNQRSKESKGALLLLPNLLGEVKHHSFFLPESVDRAVASIQGLIAESESAGRRYLGRFETAQPAHLIPIALFNQKTPSEELDFLLEPIYAGERWGLVVDAGLPCLADPGSRLVKRAMQRGVSVQAFVGPSSIVMALMLSGLPSQRFSFLGYLAKEKMEREKELLKMEKRSKAEDAVYCCIETPYRNRHLLESMVGVFRDETQLCVAWDLTLPTQGILSQSIGVWKKSPLPNLEKRNAVFLVYG